jgi:hypothetical protein
MCAGAEDEPDPPRLGRIFPKTECSQAHRRQPIVT